MCFANIGEILKGKVSLYENTIPVEESKLHEQVKESFLNMIESYTDDEVKRSVICHYASDMISPTDEYVLAELFAMDYIQNYNLEGLPISDKTFLINAYLEYTLAGSYCDAIVAEADQEVELLHDLVVDRLEHNFCIEDGTYSGSTHPYLAASIFADFIRFTMSEVAKHHSIALDLELEASLYLETYISKHIDSKGVTKIIEAMNYVHSLTYVNVESEETMEMEEPTEEVIDQPKKFGWKKIALGALGLVAAGAATYAIMKKKDDTNIVFE